MSFRELDDLLKRQSSASGQPVRYPIVIIDGDPAIRGALATVLEKGFELTLCATAQEGVQAVNEDVCAVILDVKMMGNDVLWACEEIRKRSMTVPIIFYTAYQDLKNPYEVINDHRPFGYVFKGDPVEKLVDMLGLAVKLQSILVANRKLISSLGPPSTPTR